MENYGHLAKGMEKDLECRINFFLTNLGECRRKKGSAVVWGS